MEKPLEEFPCCLQLGAVLDSDSVKHLELVIPAIKVSLGKLQTQVSWAASDWQLCCSVGWV